MKSISSHKIEDQLMALIQKKAQEKGLSLNKTIKLLLREALGLSQTSMIAKRNGFESFCGVWDEEEFSAFNQRTASFQQIDQEDWK